MIYSTSRNAFCSIEIKFILIVNKIGNVKQIVVNTIFKLWKIAFAAVRRSICFLSSDGKQPKPF